MSLTLSQTNSGFYMSVIEGSRRKHCGKRRNIGNENCVVACVCGGGGVAAGIDPLHFKVPVYPLIRVF